MYTVFQTPRDPSDWFEMSGRVLISWVILNPNGPTINCLGIGSADGKSDQTEVFWRWMHFLGGESYCLGYIDSDSRQFAQDFFDIIRHALTLEAGPLLKRCPVVTCVPSFCMALGGSEWSESFAAHLAETRAFREADWGRELYYLSKYGYQFFDRAAEEIREALEGMRKSPELIDLDVLRMTELMHAGKPGFDNWQPNQYHSRQMRAGDVEEWHKAVTSEEFQLASIQQLASMWVGASHRVAATMHVKESFEDVRDFLAKFGHPYWPMAWTTLSIAQDMGLEPSLDAREPARGAVADESKSESPRPSLAERISKAVWSRFGSKDRH